MKGIRVLAASLALSMLFVTPVYASEHETAAELRKLGGIYRNTTTTIESITSTDNNLPAETKAAIDSTVDEFGRKMLKEIAEEEQRYLATVNAQLKDAEKDKDEAKATLDLYNSMLPTHPTLQGCVDAATTDYNTALLIYNKNVKNVQDAQTKFNTFNTALVSQIKAKGAADPDAKMGNELNPLDPMSAFWAPYFAQE